MKCRFARCANWKSKCWPKGASGCERGWSKSCRNKPLVTAKFFPHSQRRLWHRRRRTMRMRTGVGAVELKVVHGQDPGDGHWGCPIRERWGLSAHQQLSPALEDKLCFTLTATGTYGQAGEVAAKWGSPIDDATLHGLAQRVGGRAEGQTQARVQGVP